MLGTAIGIFAVLLFSGLGNGVNGYIQDQINSLANPRSVTILKNTTGKKMTQDQLQMSTQNMMADPQSMFIKQSEINRVKKIAGISSVEKGYTIPSYRLSYKDLQQSGTSMDSWTNSTTTRGITNGHKPGNGEIVLTKQQAIQLSSAKNYRQLIGKTVKLSFNWVDDSGKPVQAEGNVKVSGISNGTSVRTSINSATLTKMIREANGSVQPNFLSVNVKDLNQVQTVADRVNNLRDGQNKRILGAVTVGSILKTVNTYVKLASTLLAAIAGISLLVSALMIIVTMYMSVSERTKEIGILRALGERKKDIRRLFTSESLFIGFFSAILALIIVLVVTLAINHGLYHLIKYNIIQITFGNIAFAFAVALVISFLAALLPARRAANLNPIDALAAD